ncbi:hypothetical protein TNCV_2814791 [Trichonephila clavipes]|nr:hypothetical protein TNCV_2814791 [Trichonephila clavipes]
MLDICVNHLRNLYDVITNPLSISEHDGKQSTHRRRVIVSSFSATEASVYRGECVRSYVKNSPPVGVMWMFEQRIDELRLSLITEQ